MQCPQGAPMCKKHDEGLSAGMDYSMGLPGMCLPGPKSQRGPRELYDYLLPKLRFVEVSFPLVLENTDSLCSLWSTLESHEFHTNTGQRASFCTMLLHHM